MLSHLRTLRLAAWLGWQLETNWASPWLFALYMLIKPVCGSLMLVCMFYAARHATGGRVPAEFLPVPVRLERLLRPRRHRHVRPQLRGRARSRTLPDAEVHLHQPRPLPDLLPRPRRGARTRRHRRRRAQHRRRALPLRGAAAVGGRRCAVAGGLPAHRRGDALGVRHDPRGRVPEHVAQRHVPERGNRGDRVPASAASSSRSARCRRGCNRSA